LEEIKDSDKIENEILNFNIQPNYDAEIPNSEIFKLYEIPIRLNLTNANIIRNKIASKFGTTTRLDTRVAPLSLIIYFTDCGALELYKTKII